MDHAPCHVVQVDAVLAAFRPGSQDPPWDWAHETRWVADDVDSTTGQPGAYQARLEDHLRALPGPGCGHRIHLGDDGRIWDGHHHLIAATRLGITHLAAVCTCTASQPCPAAPFDVTLSRT